MRKVSWVLLIFVLAVSCRDKGTYRDLQYVEQLLETDAAAADSILATISLSDNMRDRAYYAILKTQADYKNYITAQDDSLILTATAYYGAGKKDYHAAMAWYSLGCVYTDMGNDHSAVSAYIKAKDLFPDTLVRYYALTEQNLGQHYLNQMMFDLSLSNLNACLKNSLRLHDNVLTSNARYLIALNALYQADYPVADSLFNVLLKDPHASSLRSRQCYMNLAKIYLHGYKDYSKAMYYIERYLYELKDPSEIGIGYSVKADIFFDSEQYDSAYLYYGKSMECPEELYTVCDNSGKLAVLSIMKGYPDDALGYMQLHDQLIDSIYDMRKDIAIEDVIRNHVIMLKDSETRYRNRRLIIINTSLLAILIMVYLLYLSNRSNRIARMQIRQRDQARSNSIEIMKAHMLDAPFNDRNLSRESILKMYKEKLEVCKEMFRNTDAHSCLSSKLLNNDLSFSADERTAIINQISESFIDTILDMNIEIENLVREDIVICILSSLNFSNRFISAFINLSESGVRKRKLRLIEKSGKDFIELFISK